MAGCDVLKVKYFTAHVDGREHADDPNRQQVYLRALKAKNPGVIEIILGSFRTDAKRRRLAHAPRSFKNMATEQSVYIMQTEEKGSDVNLAVHLVNDAWMDEYDLALIISNDSDLIEGIKLVREHCHKHVAVANPTPGSRPQTELRAVMDSKRHITMDQLQNCQLPDPITGTTIHKPPAW